MLDIIQHDANMHNIEYKALNTKEQWQVGILS